MFPVQGLGVHSTWKCNLRIPDHSGKKRALHKVATKAFPTTTLLVHFNSHKPRRVSAREVRTSHKHCPPTKDLGAFTAPRLAITLSTHHSVGLEQRRC